MKGWDARKNDIKGREHPKNGGLFWLEEIEGKEMNNV